MTFSFTPSRLISKRGIFNVLVLLIGLISVIMESIRYGDYDWNDEGKLGRYWFRLIFLNTEFDSDSTRLSGYNLYMPNQAYMAIICTVFIISFLQFIAFICLVEIRSWISTNIWIHRIIALLLPIGFICGLVGTIRYISRCKNFACIILKQKDCDKWDRMMISCAGSHDPETNGNIDRDKIYETLNIDGKNTAIVSLVLTMINCIANIVASFGIIPE